MHQVSTWQHMANLALPSTLLQTFNLEFFDYYPLDSSSYAGDLWSVLSGMDVSPLLQSQLTTKPRQYRCCQPTFTYQFSAKTFIL